MSSHAFQLVLEFGIWKAWTCAFPLESKWWFVTNNINELTIIPPFKFLTSGQSYAVWKQHCLCFDVLKVFFFHTELLKVWISFSQVLGNQPSEGKVSTFSECLQTCNCSLWRTPTNTFSSIEILYYKYILLYWAVLLKNKWYIYALSNDRVFLFSSLNWKVPLPHMLCSSMCYLSCGSQQWYKGNFCWKLFLGLFYRIVFTLVYNLLPEQEKKNLFPAEISD